MHSERCIHICRDLKGAFTFPVKELLRMLSFTKILQQAGARVEVFSIGDEGLYHGEVALFGGGCAFVAFEGFVPEEVAPRDEFEGLREEYKLATQRRASEVDEYQRMCCHVRCSPYSRYPRKYPTRSP